MGIFKRAWISITRRKANSLVLMLIFFILANVLFTTLSITISLKNTKETVLSQMAPVVSISPDYSKMTGESEIPIMTGEMSEKLFSQTKDIVKSYDYTTFFTLEGGSDIKKAIIPQKEEDQMPVTENDLTYFQTEGTQLNQTSLVDSKLGELIEGKGFQESDITDGKQKAIISKQFAEANGLSVGSMFTMKHNMRDWEENQSDGTLPKVQKSQDYELEVVGILQINAVEEYIAKFNSNASKDDVVMKFYESENLANTIFVPNALNNAMQKEEKKFREELHPDDARADFLGADFVEPIYILKDMKYVSEFTEVAKTIYNEKEFTINTASDSYDIAAKPLATMEKLANLIFIIAVISSVVIISLVLCIFMYLRQKEMGIFLALGQPKSKLITQLLLETLFVALVGATLAIITSMIFSNMLAENALQSLLNPTDMMARGEYAQSNITPEIISQQYKGGFSIMSIFLFYAVTVGTIFIAQLATALYLLRLNPKKILM